MNVECVSIKRFRSIESAELSNCGGFNVLIGKNNSGKSNILAGIHAFFDCIEGSSVVTLKPPVGRELDFFEREIEFPIEITLVFSLLLAERDALIRDIVTEAPQMKNAVDGLEPSLRLSVTVSIAPPPPGFGFVSRIALGGTLRPGARSPDPERIILSVGKEAAPELHEQLSRFDQLSRDAESLGTLLPRIDEEDWRMVREGEPRSSRYPPGHMLRRLLRRYRLRMEISNELVREVEIMMVKAASYDEFSSAARALATRMPEEAARVQEEPLKNKIGTFAGEESSIPNYVRNLLGRVSEIKVLHLRERREPIGKEDSDRLLLLKVSRGGPKVLGSFQETVSALLGVQIDAFQSDSDSRRAEPVAEMDVDNFLVEVNGSGIRQALRIVLDVEFEHPNILLIEEPEIHLHPSLETGMMHYLKRVGSRCQVFISTHSTNFLDTGEMKNVYLVSKPDSTRIQLVDYDQATAQIPRELGIRLSSLFMFDRLIFVEGASDEAILREWASTLEANLSQSNVGFIHMGGVRNFTHFAAEATLSFLTKRQVRMWFIIDRDERDDAEISTLQEMAGENAAVKTLERRELENYLISPRAIAEFTGLKRELSGNRSGEELPTETDVEKTIDECAEKLKQIAIDKRVAKILCRPVYPYTKRLFQEPQDTPIRELMGAEIQQSIEQLQDAKDRVEDAYEEQSKSVDSVWQARKLDLVPGDLLLDLVCQEYGVRFKKDRDGSRLAALMNEQEIAAEIKDIVSEIGR